MSKLKSTRYPKLNKPWGIALPAFDAFVAASDKAGIPIRDRDDLRIVQTEGDAPASKGFHAEDGTLNGESYSAAVDISVRDLNHTQIMTWVEELCRAGFVAFYRNWTGNLHIHMNYAGLIQKRQLDGQNEDFFAGRDGLVGHRRCDDEWWFPSKELRRIPEKMFRVSNPQKGVGQVVTSPVFNAKPIGKPTAKPAVAIPAVVLAEKPYKLFVEKEQVPRFDMQVKDGVALCPIRKLGEALGFDVDYKTSTQAIVFNDEALAVAVTKNVGVAYAPVRDLVREIGCKMRVDYVNRIVVVSK